MFELSSDEERVETLHKWKEQEEHRKATLSEAIPLIRKALQEAAMVRTNLCNQRFCKFQEPLVLKSYAKKTRQRAEGMYKDYSNRASLSLMPSMPKQAFFGLAKNPYM